MKMFTKEFIKLIEKMHNNGHRNITVHIYPENNTCCLGSEWSLNKNEKKK